MSAAQKLKVSNRASSQVLLFEWIRADDPKLLVRNLCGVDPWTIQNRLTIPAASLFCKSDCWQTEPWEYFRLSQWAKLKVLFCSVNPNGSQGTRQSQSSSHDLWPPASTHTANQEKRGDAKQDCTLDCWRCWRIVSCETLRVFQSHCKTQTEYEDRTSKWIHN